MPSPEWTHGQPELECKRFGLTSIPIEWINAVGNPQYLHRKLTAKSNTLPKRWELRRDAPLPVNQDFVTSSFMELFVNSLDGFAVSSYGQSSAWQARVSHWIDSQGPNAWPEWLIFLQQVNSTADGAKQEQTNTGLSAHGRSLGSGLVAFAPAEAPFRIACFAWQEKNSGTCTARTPTCL